MELEPWIEEQRVEVAGEMMSVMRKEAKSDREKRAVKLTRPHQRTAMLEPVKNNTDTLLAQHF